MCLLPVAADAASITRLSPDTIAFGNVEEFLTIHGTDLVATESVLITISGPAGTFVLEPVVIEPTRLVTWVPEVVLLTEGTNTVTVAVKNLDQLVQNLGPLTFTVQQLNVPGPPRLILPELVFEEAQTVRGSFVSFEVDAVSENGAPVPVTCDHESGALFSMGTTIVVCTATDAFGTAQGDFPVVVADVTAPILTLPADFSSPTPVVQYEVSAVDNLDGPVPVTCNHPSGSTFPTGVIEVICFAYDSQFNPAVAAFYVTVSGGAPVLTLPQDITADATSTAGAVVTYEVSATDNGVVTCNPASGSTFPLGTTAVTCTATNATGTATGMFTVTVVDSSGPVLDIPDGITAEATDANGAAVTWSASATDAIDGPVAITCTPASGSQFPLGVTLVSCSATDSLGQETNGTFFVTVLDTTPPHIVSATASPDSLFPPNHKMVDVVVTVVANDLVDPAPIVRIVSVSSNQPLNGTGDGDTSPDWFITGALTLQLRAERAASADRIYTITVEAADATGNISTEEVTVRVPGSSSKKRSVR
ncbi:MAG TPA: HYR domain-containing protein [Thermoanaerobaculia bacterium]|nr:HYR domain-containing protein [Thermoanaerobaculia bacterium]